MKLDDKVCIITGASSGIGKATARLFANEGAKLAIVDINDVAGKELEVSLGAKGVEAIFIHTDVSQTSDVAEMVETVKRKFARIDVLFNCAGIFMKTTAIEDVTDLLWNRIFAVNVRSLYLTAKYAVPVMKSTGGGVIINVSSISAVRPPGYYVPYASSKGAVVTFTKALAHELASSNIRVNCISPTLTETPMLEFFSKHRIEVATRATPLGRLANPEDVAQAALFLASEESAMMTGAEINVDGGLGI